MLQWNGVYAVNNVAEIQHGFLFRLHGVNDFFVQPACFADLPQRVAGETLAAGERDKPFGAECAHQRGAMAHAVGGRGEQF